MTSKRTAKRSPIPEFATREEEAAFWDTHDISDYWDELRPTRARFAKQLSEGITIRLDPETLARLRSLASEMGIGPTTLARIWILEHVRQMPPSPVVERTAGALGSRRPPNTAEQLREAAERSIAKEAVQRSR